MTETWECDTCGQQFEMAVVEKHPDGSTKYAVQDAIAILSHEMKHAEALEPIKWIHTEGGTQQMTNEELLERIKGEVRAVADGGIERLGQTTRNALSDTGREIDDLVKNYQAIAEAMPMNLLEVVQQGGKVELGAVNLDKTCYCHPNLVDVEVRVDHNRLQPLRMELPEGKWQLILVAIPDRTGGKP